MTGLELLVGFSVFAGVLMAAQYLDVLAGSMPDRLAETFHVSRRNPIEEAADEVASEQGMAQRLVESRLAKRLKSMATTIMPASALEDITRRLNYAGGVRGLTPEDFYSLKLMSAALVFGVVSSVMIVGTGWRGMGMGIAAGAAGYLLPDFWLNGKVAKRRREIETALLGYTDMLAVACDAGLSLHEAVERVSDYVDNTLGEEMRRTIKEVTMGRPMAEAFLALGERNGVDDLHLLASALAQAVRHGTPIARVLKDQANQLRTLRRTRAQEMAQKAGAKMLVPVVMFMFVPMMILLLGPAVRNLLRALGF